MSAIEPGFPEKDLFLFFILQALKTLYCLKVFFPVLKLNSFPKVDWECELSPYLKSLTF